jgi:cobalt-zinc-cadmium efflux system protein
MPDIWSPTAAALVIALIAQAIGQRPPSRRATYGYARVEVLAAFINALAMLP